MSNLTQQIAGAYIGAQVHWNGDTQCRVIDVIRSKYLHNMKLILTPISAISDEDKIQVGEILGENNPEFTELELSILGGVFAIGARTNLGIDFPFHVVKETIDYLRSRNYDLGYMGIRSLIDAGIAISSLDKTETK